MSTLEQLRQDVLYGFRMLVKSPVFSTVAILSLALGIGANTAIFTLIDTVLLRMLPVKDPQQLVSLTDPTSGGVNIGTQSGERNVLSTREFEGLRERTTMFSGVFAAQSQLNRDNASINGGNPEEVRSRLVSAEYFTVLGASTAIGRTFTRDDDHGKGSMPLAVISHDFWQRRFGGAPSALGAHIRVGKADLTVVGVAERRFLGENVGEAPEVWVPLNMQPQVMPGRMWLEDDPGHIAEKVMWLHAIARLKPGVTREQAQANVDVVFKQIVAEEFAKLSQSQPEILKQTLKLRSAGTGVSSLRGGFADPLYVLMGVVGLVLAIACANVANLLLARAAARQKEMSVRLSLGASRGRIVRQFLTESLMLAVAGGAVGSLLAVVGVRLLLGMVQPSEGAMMLDVTPDLRVLGFTIAVCLLTGVAFGLAPAWRSARVNVAGSLKEAGRGLTGGRSRMGLGKMLVIGQIALSVMLLIGAGWFLRSLSNLEKVDLGYPREKILLFGVDFTAAGYKDERLPIVFGEVHERLARIPGVRAVTYSANGLFNGSESGDRISVEGYKPEKRGDDSARFDQVGPAYFATVGIPMLLGRDIGPQDIASGESVCVVNETFAKFYFGGRSPIGKHVTDEFPDTRKTFTIVGVAKDARDHQLRGDVRRRFYISARQPLGTYPGGLWYEIRTYGDPARIVEAARRQVRELNPDLTIDGSKPLVALLDSHLRQERLIAKLSTAFSGLALLLACVGLYGVLSYAVAQRTNEIGIRMALGAERGRVVGMILRETGILIGIGVLVGVPASLACGKLVESKLFGLKPADPMTVGVAMAILIAVSVLSGYLPARRASKVDPLVALRYE